LPPVSEEDSFFFHLYCDGTFLDNDISAIKDKLVAKTLNNIYAWFGYEYRRCLSMMLPSIQEFFREVPYEFKINKKLYDSFLVNGLFKEYGLNQSHKLQPPARIQRTGRLKKKLKKLISGALLPCRPYRQDPFF
jgi:hypothetical protein